MSLPGSIRIQDHFRGLTDPRRRKVVYPLINIVAIAACAVIAGADDFVTIALWARQKRGWLAKILDLRSGIPSHDRFNAVLGALKPGEFQTCLPSWISAPHAIRGGQIIAIDGKTPRGSFDRASSKTAIHMVSARATANHISLGQVVVNQKSNEITAIPRLLKMPAISGSLVTIDAMGCQAAIAEAIVAGDADYVLAVKANQPTLHEGVEAHFLDHMDDDFARVKASRHETTEHGHGRDEHRTCFVCDVPVDVPDRGRWKGSKRIGVAIGDTVRNGKPSDDVRYHILSKRLTAKSFGAAVRGHWGIESSLHRQLDLTFGEDRSRIRKGNADANFSILRRTALSLLKNEGTEKVGVRSERLATAWSETYLEEVLFGS